jgi:hypothetical protein
MIAAAAAAEDNDDDLAKLSAVYPFLDFLSLSFKMTYLRTRPWGTGR